MKFNHLILVRRKSKHRGLRAAPRKEHWPWYHSPRAASGQGMHIRKVLCNQAHRKEIAPQALHLPWNFPLLYMVGGRVSGKVNGPEGGKKNACSPEHNEQDLKLWKNSNKTPELHPVLLRNSGSLCRRVSYSVTQCECNILGNSKGPNLRRAKWSRKKNRILRVTTTGACDRKWFQKKFRQLKSRKYVWHRKKWKLKLFFK